MILRILQTFQFKVFQLTKSVPQSKYMTKVHFQHFFHRTNEHEKQEKKLRNFSSLVSKKLFPHFQLWMLSLIELKITEGIFNEIYKKLLKM